jgi:hypothetical protein
MTALIAAGLGMSVAIVIDIGASRLRLPRAVCYAASLSLGFFACLTSAMLIASQPRLESIVMTILTYLAWWYIFLNLSQAMESSLRVRLVREIDAAGGQLSRATLNKIYNDYALLALRRDRLLSGGALVAREGRLLVASTGLKAIAAIFRVLKLVFIGRTSEFDGINE